MKLVVLGREDKISQAELISVFGASKVTRLSQDIALVDTDKLDIDKFGGIIKSAQVVDRLNHTDWSATAKWLENNITKVFPFDITDNTSKKTFGFSVYGQKVSDNQINKLAFSIKKQLRKMPEKPSIRVLRSKKQELSSAQILHNNLDDPSTGTDIIIVFDRNSTIIAHLEGMQNIEYYTKRDHDRPKRDPLVGMLPPKLAQIMINLATGQSDEIDTIVDPFCGTGVVLQEALLLGYDTFGSDIDERMISYTDENMLYIKDNFDITNSWSTEVVDAKNVSIKSKNPAIVSEIYLGKPLKKHASRDELQELKSEISDLLKQFLLNLHDQVPKGTKICLAIPAWSYGSSFVLPPVVDQIQDLGYNPMRFKGISDKDLIYHRQGQYVGRKLLVLERK